MPASFGDSGVRITTVRGAVIAVWSGTPTVARVGQLAKVLDEHSRSESRGICLYNVITSATPIPTAEVRAALVGHFDAMRGRLRAAAIVLEKDGVKGTLSRSFLSTLLALSRQPFPMKIFSSRDEGAEWLAGLEGGPSSAVLTSSALVLESRLRAEGG